VIRDSAGCPAEDEELAGLFAAREGFALHVDGLDFEAVGEGGEGEVFGGGALGIGDPGFAVFCEEFGDGIEEEGVEAAFVEDVGGKDPGECFIDGGSPIHVEGADTVGRDAVV